MAEESSSAMSVDAGAAAAPATNGAAAAAAGGGGVAFDVDSYIVAYEGETKLQRLHFIAKKVLSPQPSRSSHSRECRADRGGARLRRRRSSATRRRSSSRAGGSTTWPSRGSTRRCTPRSARRCVLPHGARLQLQTHRRLTPRPPPSCARADRRPAGARVRAGRSLDRQDRQGPPPAARSACNRRISPAAGGLRRPPRPSTTASTRTCRCRRRTR